jgi:hypothetical protein
MSAALCGAMQRFAALFTAPPVNMQNEANVKLGDLAGAGRD